MASVMLVFILYQVERVGCEVLARLLGALDPVLVLERLSLQMFKQTIRAMLDLLGWSGHCFEVTLRRSSHN